MMRRRWVVIGAASVLWLAVACLDVSSPVSGIGAISPIQLPMPSVVVGDSLRDLSGNVSPLSVIVFGTHGDTVHDATVRFFVTQSSDSLAVDSASGKAFGIAVSSSAKVVATITPAKGGGFIQTQPITLPVVQQPVSAQKDTDFTFLPKFPTTDTLSTRLISSPIRVTVKAADGVTGVPSYPVIFTLIRWPRSKTGSTDSTVVLTNSSGLDTTVAITGSTGVAQIYLRLRPSAMREDLFAVTDTAVVRYEVRFQGKKIPVTPPDSFVIQVRATVAAP